jgi:hypothetical protein
MDHLEIWQTIDEAIHDALIDRLHLLSESALIERADALLREMPVVGSTQPTARLLLRRYRGALQKELCNGREPRPLSDVVEDEMRELTHAVMVAVDAREGFSVETAVLLALAIRAGGLAKFCAASVGAFTA